MATNRWFTQEKYVIRCEWGEHGVNILAPLSDAVIIVDVLSFSTCVDIVIGRGGTVLPYHWKDERASHFARAQNAVLAAPGAKYQLSPSNLLDLPAETRLVLPSPNGSTLSQLTGDILTFTACLRNAQAGTTASTCD